MTGQNAKNKEAKRRDHTHARPGLWHQPHRSWKVWLVVMLMIAMVVVYILSDDLSLRPGEPPTQPIPAMDAL